ncbi:MAG: DUF6442 family protein [Defluviitaleaceae bacterium]|nr:DUF6442 family protein [Defluviitaleaceae bacterium]
MENSNSRKEEILAKNRNSKEDEGLEFAENRGRKIGYIAFVVVLVFLTLTNTFLEGGTPETGSAIAALAFAFTAADCYARYQFRKKVWYAVIAVTATVAVIVFCAFFVIATVGR